MNFKERSLLHRLTARSRKNRAMEYILDRTGKDLEGKNWIFLLGCYNSGTTLLNQILAGHPAISGLPDEGVMLTTQLVKPEDFGWRRMWYKCEDEMENSPVNQSKSPETIKRHWSHFYGEKEFLVEKSISNVCRIPFFEKNFKPAYFIHIVRNGYAAAEGIRRKAEIIPGNEFYGNEHYPIELCINQWIETLKKVERYKGELSNFMEISYESLSENPEKVMNEVTDFLKIEPFEPGFFDKSFSVHEKSGGIRNMNPASFKRLTPEEIEIINTEAGDYLTKYGYPLL